MYCCNVILPANFGDTKQEVSFPNWSVVILSLNPLDDNAPVDITY